MVLVLGRPGTARGWTQGGRKLWCKFNGEPKHLSCSGCSGEWKGSHHSDEEESRGSADWSGQKMGEREDAGTKRPSAEIRNTGGECAFAWNPLECDYQFDNQVGMSSRKLEIRIRSGNPTTLRGWLRIWEQIKWLREWTRAGLRLTPQGMVNT